MSFPLPKPALIFVIDYDRQPDRQYWQRLSEEALKGGCDWVILRTTMTPIHDLRDFAQELRKLTSQSGALLSVRNHLGFAQSIDADGVHYSEDRLQSGIEPYRLVGCSVHSVENGSAAKEQGANYLIAGSIFATSTHPGKVPEGLPLLTALRKAVDLPVYAIGGLTCENAGQAIRAGAWGVAVISGIADAKNPRQASEQFKQILLENVTYETAVY